jgi:hypothetical protein
VQVGDDELGQLFLHEGRAAAEHLVRDAAQRVDVGARIEGVGERLLRREVRGRAHHHAHLGEARALLGVGDARDAEVENLGHFAAVAAPADHDVRRLQVAVHDAARVRFLEALGHLEDQVDRAHRTQRSGAREHVVQRGALDELHRQKRLTVAGLSEVEDAHDVRALELADQLGLALEARPHVRIVGEHPAQELQRDGALQVDVRGPVDVAHATRGEVAFDLEAAVEQRAGLQPLVSLGGGGDGRRDLLRLGQLRGLVDLRGRGRLHQRVADLDPGCRGLEHRARRSEISRVERHHHALAAVGVDVGHRHPALEARPAHALDLELDLELGLGRQVDLGHEAGGEADDGAPHRLEGSGVVELQRIELSLVGHRLRTRRFTSD